MHDRAEELLPLCDLQLLQPVIEFNRGLNWFWWTAALLEVGEQEQAEQLLRDRTEDLWSSCRTPGLSSCGSAGWPA